MHDDHDYLRSTGHLDDPERDYSNFRMTGANVARSGLRTRHANPERGVYDFEDAVRQARAAERHGIFVYWDLCHYDFPRWIKDPWGAEMVEAFTELGVAFADRLHAEGLTDFGLCAWNEIILWSMWVESGNAAQSVVERAPGRRHRAWRNLGIKTTFAVMREVRKKHPGTKFLIAEPAHREGILSFLDDMRSHDPELMDDVVIGLNMYPITDLPHTMEDPASYFVSLVDEIRGMYPRNELMISETSSVGDWGLPDRMKWLDAMLDVQERAGIETMIWYPALNYGAWHDENVLVEHGAWDQDAERTPFAPLVDAVSRRNGAPRAPERLSARPRAV